MKVVPYSFSLFSRLKELEGGEKGHRGTILAVKDSCHFRNFVKKTFSNEFLRLCEVCNCLFCL